LCMAPKGTKNNPKRYLEPAHNDLERDENRIFLLLHFLSFYCWRSSFLLLREAQKMRQRLRRCRNPFGKGNCEIFVRQPDLCTS
jgi:hypothetical protein